MSPPAWTDLWERPIVVAPMAGGPSTPGLVAASAEAGGLGFLAAGYKQATDVEADIAEVRASTPKPFGINVFVPGAPTPDPQRLNAYLDGLAAEAEALGVELGSSAWDDDQWDAKVGLRPGGGAGRR